MRPEHEPEKKLVSLHVNCFHGKLNVCVYSYSHSFYYSLTYVTDIYKAPNMLTTYKIIEEIQKICPQLSGSRPNGKKTHQSNFNIKFRNISNY